MYRHAEFRYNPQAHSTRNLSFQPLFDPEDVPVEFFVLRPGDPRQEQYRTQPFDWQQFDCHWLPRSVCVQGRDPYRAVRGFDVKSQGPFNFLVGSDSIMNFIKAYQEQQPQNIFGFFIRPDPTDSLLSKITDATREGESVGADLRSMILGTDLSMSAKLYVINDVVPVVKHFGQELFLEKP